MYNINIIMLYEVAGIYFGVLFRNLPRAAEDNYRRRVRRSGLLTEASVLFRERCGSNFSTETYYSAEHSQLS